MTGRPDDIDEAIWNEAFARVYDVERAAGDPAVAADLEAWLAASPAHARAYAQVRRVWRAAPHLRTGGRRSDAGRRYLSRHLDRRAWLAGAGAVAAGGVMAVLGGAYLEDADYRTGTGETRAATLADGSRVTLDTDTALRVAITDTGRLLTLLRGQAFFEVAHDPDRLFAVQAGDEPPVSVVAVGTAFDVRLDEARVAVAVAEGQVAVLSKRHPEVDGALLEPGRRMSLPLGGGTAQMEAADPGAVAAWRGGRLVVEGWTVAAVLDELGRYHRGTILLRDADLGARRVSGSYDLARPAEAVRAVAEAQGGRMTAITPWLLVVAGG